MWIIWGVTVLLEVFSSVWADVDVSEMSDQVWEQWFKALGNNISVMLRHCFQFMGFMSILRLKAFTRQEAMSHGQSLQEAIYRAQQSRQEARDRGQSQWKPNMTDSLCRKRKLADSFIPCVHMK